MDYQSRTYRKLVTHKHLTAFRVVAYETDLHVHTESAMKAFTKKRIREYRKILELFITKYPNFRTMLTPFQIAEPMPRIINEMIHASSLAGVGPMATVAGVIAEYVGRDLMKYSKEVIVENGGDIFFMLKERVTIGIFAGASKLSMRVGIMVDTNNKPISICTSSGTIGHSLSLGKADAVSVVSRSCALADAAATAIANQIKTGDDIGKAIDFGKQIAGVEGLVAIIGDNIGFWGNIKVVPIGVTSK